jgi:predicted SnoaL-like aldol condensation-catalyzing enzyme
MITQSPQDLREQNKELVRRYYDLIVRQCDFDAAARLLAPDFMLHYPKSRAGEDMDGRAWIESIRKFCCRQTDMRLVLEDQVAEDDKVVSRWLLSSKQNHKDFEVSSLDMFRIRDGLIIEEWMSVDLLDYYGQVWVTQARIVMRSSERIGLAHESVQREVQHR